MDDFAPPPATERYARSAQQQVLESLEELLAQQDHHLSLPVSRLNQAVSDVVRTNGKIVTRLTEKILRAADRELVQSGNTLDTVQTRVLMGLDAWSADIHHLLTQLAAKGGITRAGEGLADAILREASGAPELTYGATMVLAVDRLMPLWGQLIEVLREIRDRLPSRPVHEPGEPRSTAPAVESAEIEIVPVDEEPPSKGW